jgi:hypothetical protein
MRDALKCEKIVCVSGAQAASDFETVDGGWY